MAVCAIVSAMFADTSLRVRSCALAGAAKVQARPTPASRYNTTDMMDSSLSSPDRWTRRRGLRSKPSAFPPVCTGVGRGFPLRAADVVSADMAPAGAAWACRGGDPLFGETLPGLAWASLAAITGG